MKKKIIFICASFIVLTISLYRLKTTTNRVTPERIIHGTIIIIWVAVLFKMAIKTFYKKIMPPMIDNSEYFELEEFKQRTVKGEVQFFFKMNKEKQVQFTIVDKDLKEVSCIADSVYDVGNVILRYDTKLLPDGTYFYKLTSDNQVSMKKFFIQNQA